LTDRNIIGSSVRDFSEPSKAAAPTTRSKAHSRGPTFRRRQDGDGTGSFAWILC
jgi:hypothetical protein